MNGKDKAAPETGLDSAAFRAEQSWLSPSGARLTPRRISWDELPRTPLTFAALYSPTQPFSAFEIPLVKTPRTPFAKMEEERKSKRPRMAVVFYRARVRYLRRQTPRPPLLQGAPRILIHACKSRGAARARLHCGEKEKLNLTPAETHELRIHARLHGEGNSNEVEL